MINFQFWPVMVGTLAATILGILWHASARLKTRNGGHTPPWLRPTWLLGTLIGNLLYAGTLELVLVSLNTFSLIQGASLGIVIGAGIVLPTLLLNNVHRGRGWSNCLITAAYPICCLVMIGAILGVWPRS